MLDRLRAESDIIVVDSPALMEFADATALAKAVDTVLIAVRIGRSRRDKLDDCGAASRNTRSRRWGSS